MRIVSKMLIASLCVLLSVCHEAGAKGRNIFELLPQLKFSYSYVDVVHSKNLVSTATVPYAGGTITATYSTDVTLRHTYYNGFYSRTDVANIVITSFSLAYSTPSTTVTPLPGGSSLLSSVYLTTTGNSRVSSVSPASTLFDFTRELRIDAGLTGPGVTPVIYGNLTITAVTNLP